jgi:hypothetical protein
MIHSYMRGIDRKNNRNNDHSTIEMIEPNYIITKVIYENI